MPDHATSHPRFDAVICDIDGCLSDEGTAPFDLGGLARVAAHNRRAIEARDVPVVTVCTGRPQPFAEAMCRAIRNTDLPCIAENGVWLYHPGTNEYVIDPAIQPEHVRAVHEAEAWLRDRYQGKGVSQQPGKAASVSLYHPDTAYLMDEILPSVRDEVAERRYPFRVSRTEVYINLDLSHVSKSTGLDRLLARTGLSTDRLAGIGDSASDKAIRDRVAHFACPANAVDEIKAHADLVADTPQIDGVLEILETLVG